MANDEKGFKILHEHSDFLDRPATNTFHAYNQLREVVRCPHCGEWAELGSEIYTSIPPQRKWTCKECGESGFIFCDHPGIVVEYEGLPRKKLKVSCAICGEPYDGEGKVCPVYICEKCRKAVLKVRNEEDTAND